MLLSHYYDFFPEQVSIRVLWIDYYVFNVSVSLHLKQTCERKFSVKRVECEKTIDSRCRINEKTGLWREKAR